MRLASGARWLGATLLALICLFAGLDRIGLVGPDEPRYAAVARTMSETGDWLTPRLYGKPWFEKPVLYYWAAAAAFRLLGPSETAARLPSALAAAIATALLVGFCRRQWGSQVAFTLLLILPSALGLWSFAHAATMDMLLAGTLAAAMTCCWQAVQAGFSISTGGHERRWRMAAAAAIGLAVLAKGPVGVLLAGGSVLLWAALTRQWAAALQFLRWDAVGTFCLVTLPWYVACALVNPGFLAEFLWLHNVQRYLTPVFAHVQPWWFFLPVLALGLFPWTALLLEVAAQARSCWPAPPRSAGLFVACWTAFPVVFFSFSHSKLPGYVLPSVAPLAVLIARAVTRDGVGSWAHRFPLALAGASWALLAVGSGLWLRRLPIVWLDAHHGTVHRVAMGVFVAGAILTALALRGARQTAIAGHALTVAGLVLLLSWVILPQLDPWLSPRVLAESLARQVPGADIALYEVPRAWQYGLEYYLQRPLPVWPGQATAPAWICTPASRLAQLTAQAQLVGAPRELPGDFVLVRVQASRLPTPPR